jgi:hypothetical protein
VQNNIRNFIFVFSIGLVLGAGFVFIVFGPGRTGPLDRDAAANARAAEELVEQLGRTVTEQQSRITDLESSNSRLAEHIMGTGRISESLAGTVAASGANTASAAQVSARLRAGIEELEAWYNNILRSEPWLSYLDDE